MIARDCHVCGGFGYLVTENPSGRKPKPCPYCKAGKATVPSMINCPNCDAQKPIGASCPVCSYADPVS
jgi:hypothetical protein